jgi:hypothetical protein
MKLRILLLAAILAIAVAYPIHTAETEGDIKAFRARHIQDTSVLYFVNLSAEKQTGFWSSLFSLFGSTSESDETYLPDIAESSPVLKIDVGQEALENSTNSYGVDSVPFVIAFHHGEEILRGTPSSSTGDNIDKAVREKEANNLHATNPVWTTHPERNGTDTVPNDLKTEEDVHHHPAPLTVIPDFGHMSANDPAESSLVTSRPIQELDARTGANAMASATPIPAPKSDDQLVVYKDGSVNSKSEPRYGAAITSQSSASPTRATRASTSIQGRQAAPSGRPTTRRGMR